MSSNIIEIKNVTQFFDNKEVVALNNINFSVPKGMITGLVGPDGAGKTTLIRLMTGLLIPSEGSISVFGYNTVSQQKEISNVIGYMPQKFGLYEDLTVIENLNLYASLQNISGGEKSATFDKLLDFTDLKSFKKRYAGNLSGGMKQKLGLACALLGNPNLLLLDEPGVGVDPISRRELWLMVKELVSQGASVLWSTAYLDEAEQFDNVALLNAGNILFEGKPEHLTKRLEGRVFQIQGLSDIKRTILKNVLQHKGIIDGVIQGDNIRIVLSNDKHDFDINKLGIDGNIKILPAKPRFEDAFIDILGGITTRHSELAEAISLKNHEEVVIEANNLTKKYGAFIAAKNISFTIKKGEIFGLLGPNGAGKSTTFKMLCGLIQSTCGEAKVIGLDFKTALGKARENIGYMAQKFSLYSELSVMQNLEFFSGIYGMQRGVKRERINEMVDIFNLERYLDDNAGTLPLGYKQRLALACAVMHNPSIIFLDEPTSGVDPITRREFWTHINNMVDKGVTVMVTTHFMDEAEYCDRISLIYRGQSIATGSPDYLKNLAKSPDMPDPTMEDAFVALIKRFDENAGGDI